MIPPNIRARIAGRKVGGSRNAPSGGHAPANSRLANPRSASTVPGSINRFSSYEVFNETKNLSNKTVMGQTLPLPMLDDIVNATLDFSVTVTSGSLAGGTESTYSAIDHILIKPGRGDEIVNVLGSQLPALYLDFSPYTLALPGNTASVTGGATSATISGQIEMPWLTLPKHIQYYMTVYYAPYTAVDANATSGSITNDISVHYGDVEGMESHFANQSIALVAGNNPLQNVISVQDTPIHEWILQGFNTDARLSYLEISSLGRQIEAHLTGTALIARDAQFIQGARPTGTFFLRSKSSFIANSRSTVKINDTGSDTVTSGYYWRRRVA